jgi:hypothetical protein
LASTEWTPTGSFRENVPPDPRVTCTPSTHNVAPDGFAVPLSVPVATANVTDSVELAGNVPLPELGWAT